MTKLGIGALIAFVISGCAIAPPIQTDSLSSTESFHKVSDFIYSQAVKCWTRDLHPLKGDAFIVEQEIQGEITVSRQAFDIGKLRPFMKVTVVPENPTTIVVSEGKCAYGCNMNFTPDIRRWMSGDLSCSKELYRREA